MSNGNHLASADKIQRNCPQAFVVLMSFIEFPFKQNKCLCIFVTLKKPLQQLTARSEARGRRAAVSFVCFLSKRK